MARPSLSAIRHKEGTIYDIALLDWQSRQVRKLTNETSKTYSWSPVAWTADGKYLFANRSEVSGVPESDVYRIEVASGKTADLTAHTGKALYTASSLSPDGKELLITSEVRGGYQNVVLLDVETKKRTWVTDMKWEANSGNFSPDATSFTYTINQDGRTDAYIVHRGTGEPKKIELAEGLNFFVGIPRLSLLTASGYWSSTRAQLSRVISGFMTSANMHQHDLPSQLSPASQPHRCRPPRSSITSLSTARSSAHSCGYRSI